MKTVNMVELDLGKDTGFKCLKDSVILYNKRNNKPMCTLYEHELYRIIDAIAEVKQLPESK